MPAFLFRTALLIAFLFGTISPAAAILQKGEAAPPINVVSTSGQKITLANYRGYVLVLDFFATWCDPCKEIIPHLIDLNRRYGKKGLQVLGMNVDDDEKGLKEFVAQQKMSYPVAFANEDLRTEYGLRSVPTIYVISKKGVVSEKYMGYNDQTRKALEKTIQRLLAE